MKLLMWDLMRADQFLGTYVLNKDSTINPERERLTYYNRVFSIHQISRETFLESFSYYKTHPVLFKAILDSISTPDNSVTEREMNPILAPIISDTSGDNKNPVQKDSVRKPLRRKPTLPD